MDSKYLSCLQYPNLFDKISCWINSDCKIKLVMSIGGGGGDLRSPFVLWPEWDLMVVVTWDLHLFFGQSETWWWWWLEISICSLARVRPDGGGDLRSPFVPWPEWDLMLVVTWDLHLFFGQSETWWWWWLEISICSLARVRPDGGGDLRSPFVLWPEWNLIIMRIIRRWNPPCWLWAFHLHIWPPN